MFPPTETSKLENSDIQTLQPMGFTDILDGMFSLYRQSFRLFLQIAAITIFAELIACLLIDFDPQGTFPLIIASIIKIPLSVVSIGGTVIVTASCYSGTPITARSALQHVAQRFFPLLASAALWGLVVVVLSITIIGIPFAIYFAIRWSFFVDTLLLEAVSVRDALKRSSELVSSMWWRMCGMLLSVFLMSTVVHAVFEVLLAFFSFQAEALVK